MRCYCGNARVPHKKGEGRHCRTRANAAATSTEFTGAESYAAHEIIEGTAVETSNTSYGGYDSSSSSSYDSSSSSGSDSYGGY